MDVRSIEEEGLEGDGFNGGIRVGIERDGDRREVVEGDGGSGGGDVVDVRGGGAGVEGRSGGEDDDGEGWVVVEDELT